MSKYEYRIDISPGGAGLWNISRRERTPGWFKRWRRIGTELRISEAERFLQQVKLNDEKYG